MVDNINLGQGQLGGNLSKTNVNISECHETSSTLVQKTKDICSFRNGYV